MKIIFIKIAVRNLFTLLLVPGSLLCSNITQDSLVNKNAIEITRNKVSQEKDSKELAVWGRPQYINGNKNTNGVSNEFMLTIIIKKESQFFNANLLMEDIVKHIALPLFEENFVSERFYTDTLDSDQPSLKTLGQFLFSFKDNNTMNISGNTISFSKENEVIELYKETTSKKTTLTIKEFIKAVKNETSKEALDKTDKIPIQTISKNRTNVFLFFLFIGGLGGIFYAIFTRASHKSP